MKRIMFKNGTFLDVPQEVIEILHIRIVDGCNNFQIFSNKENETECIINVSEIVYIANIKK